MRQVEPRNDVGVCLFVPAYIARRVHAGRIVAFKSDKEAFDSASFRFVPKNR